MSERSARPSRAQRIERHVRWAREHGLRRLVEEDQLNPITRASLAYRKWQWRRAHDVRPNAVPVFVVGVQRSGTNMLTRGLESRPEIEVHNENSRRAFDGFRLRPEHVIREIVVSSGHRHVVFKPLCDSHRTPDLLDGLGTPSRGRAVWAYRSVDGRVRSAVAKFGSDNLVALREIAAGRGDGMWQAQGLSAENRELIESFDYENLSPESAAALFWYVRNSLYFELGLDRRDDVMLASYDALVAGPELVIRSLCSFLELRFDEDMIDHIERRTPPSTRPLVIDDEIRTLCDRLTARLDRAAAAHLERP